MKHKRQPSPSASSSTPSNPDLTGETFDDFRILRKLGQGGMGEVYLAEQVSLNRKVAIKLLREDVAANPVAIQRFKEESKIVAQLSHANVVQVYMIGEHAGRHYMVLEYVEGKSLRDYIVRTGPLDIPLVLSLMRKVSSALHRACEMGIVHRDLKPENILVTKKGEAKVADFGLSRCLGRDQPLDLTRAGTTVGTPLYMSPEQVEGKTVDYRSDIYSFGVTCYYMLAGHPPFEGSNAFEVALKHVRDEPAPLEEVRPEVPPGLCGIVRKMMAKNPDERYQSAYELLQDIAGLRASLGGTGAATSLEAAPTETIPAEERRPKKRPVKEEASATETIPAAEATPESVPVRKRKRSRKNRRRWVPIAAGAGGALVLVLLVVIVILSWPRRPAVVAEGPNVPSPVQNTSPEPEPPKGKDEEEVLRRMVDQHLGENAPNPNGVEPCIDLAVIYLDQNRVDEAEGLFKRMDQRRPPSAYHFVGRLGLAVTDALKNNARASQGKFMELFDPRSRDNRVQVLNDYLTKNPEFAKWVNEADSHNIRNGAVEVAIPQGMRRWSGKFPTFKKP